LTASGWRLLATLYCIDLLLLLDVLEHGTEAFVRHDVGLLQLADLVEDGGG
jgi:hypothetical protein